jgi:hypothetical protein
MKSPLRRGGVLVAALSVAIATFAIAPAANAVTGDPRPVTEGAGWLAGQLTDGIIQGQYGPDYGLSIDTAFALKAVNAQPEAVRAIHDAIATNVNKYTDYTYDYNGTHSGIASNAVAKALVLAEVTGSDPTSFGGVNLVSKLESLVSNTAPRTGRIEDSVTPTTDPDDANTLGQAYAARGLSVAGSSRAADVTSFLLEQQCSEGYFRLGLTADKTATDQTCDGGKAAGQSPADSDATSVAVLQLSAIPTPDAAVVTAITTAKQWLVNHQHADGSFGGGTSTEVSNANSTGLAAWALGDTAASRRAAVWLRAHQAHDAGACVTALHGDRGALAYDDATLADGRQNGIGTDTQDQWRRATAQALPGLLYAAPAPGALGAVRHSGYVKARSTVRTTVTGAAPGDSVCVGSNPATANRNGSAVARVTLPGGTGLRTYGVRDSARRASSVVLKALGARTFKVVAAHRPIRHGRLQRVVARGLAPHEKLTVLFRGHVIRHAYASADGTYRTSFRVGHKRGLAKLAVRGKFPTIRSGRAWFRVL